MVDKGLTTAEFARRAGKSRQYIFRLVKEGVIPAEQIGGRYIISEKDAQKLLGNNLSSVNTETNQTVVNLMFTQYGDLMRRLAHT